MQSYSNARSMTPASSSAATPSASYARSTTIAQPNRTRVVTRTVRPYGDAPSWDGRVQHLGETTVVAVKWLVWFVMLGCTLLVIYVVYKLFWLRGTLNEVQTRVERVIGQTRNDLMQNYATLKARGQLLPWTVEHVLRWSDVVRVDVEKGPLHVHVDVLPNQNRDAGGGGGGGLAPSEMIPPRVDRRGTAVVPLKQPVVDEWSRTGSALAAADMHATVNWRTAGGKEGGGGNDANFALANVNYSPHTPGIPIRLSILPDILGGDSKPSAGSSSHAKDDPLHHKQLPQGDGSLKANCDLSSSSMPDSSNNSTHQIQYDEILQYMMRAYGYCMEQSRALIETFERLIQPPMRALDALCLSRNNNSTQPASSSLDASTWRTPFAELYRNTRALLAMLHTCVARIRASSSSELGESSNEDGNVVAIPDMPKSFVAYFEDDRSQLLGLDETLAAFQNYKQEFYPQLERAVWSFAMRCKSRVTASTTTANANQQARA